MIFDLDGTLVDTNGIHLENFRKDFPKQFGFRPKDSEVLPLFGKSAVEIAQILARKRGIKLDAKKLVEFARLKESLFVKSAKGKHFLSKANFLFLKKLKARGLKIAIASGSSRKMLNASLKTFERKLFDCIVCADDVLHSKPNPLMIFKALKCLRVKKGNAVFVGDGFLDAKTAKNANLRFVAVLSGITSRKQFEKFKPLLIVKKARDLGKVL